MFNFYRHWAQLLLRQLREPPVTIMFQEVVTQGDPLSMVLDKITLIPLSEELRMTDPRILSLFYADDATLDSSPRQSAQLLKLLMEIGTDRGYFPETSKSLFISDTPGQEEEERMEFAV